MANKFCSNCGKKISETEKFCSKCGIEINGEEKNNKKNNNKNSKVICILRYIFGGIFVLGSLTNLINGNWYGIIELIFAISLFPIFYQKFISKIVKNEKTLKILQIIIPIILFIVFCACIPSDNTLPENNYSSHSGNETNTSTKNNSQTKELTESEKMIVKISTLFDEKLAFDTGSYIKGDIPAGEYAFVKFDGSGSYYEEDDAAGNIVDNENFDSFGYVKVHSVGNITTRGVLININAFEKLEVTGAKEIYEILNGQSDYNQSGYYKVGVDIPAGTYVLESIGSAYYAIMTGPVSDNDIVDNDNFNGKKQITISNGQYLDLSRAKITQ